MVVSNNSTTDLGTSVGGDSSIIFDGNYSLNSSANDCIITSSGTGSNAAIYVKGDMVVDGTLTIGGSSYGDKDVTDDDVFKKITTLLGIKIINVSIKDGKMVMYGRRNRRRFVINIDARRVTVTNDKGVVITEIALGSYSEVGSVSPFYPNYPQTTIGVEGNSWDASVSNAFYYGDAGGLPPQEGPFTALPASSSVPEGKNLKKWIKDLKDGKIIRGSK